MAALSESVKLYVVQRLACYEPLNSIVESVKQDFGIDVTKPQLLAYDPNKAQGQRLSAKLKLLFEDTRKHFLENTSSIPIANKAVRLNTLQRLVDDAERRKNPVLVANLLEQAAKEVGETYTNKQKVDHISSDGSMTPKALDTTKLSTGALKEILAARANSPD